jgi:hypothetical protein
MTRKMLQIEHEPEHRKPYDARKDKNLPKSVRQRYVRCGHALSGCGSLLHQVFMCFARCSTGCDWTRVLHKVQKLLLRANKMMSDAA